MSDPRSAVPPAGPPTDLWEDDAWDDLLAGIREHQVVPIVGPDLMVIELDGTSETLERFLARELSGRLAWPRGAPAADATLNDVASTWIQSGGDCERQRKTISKEIERILRETDFAPPVPLRKLAEIGGLRLFVNLTFDDLLERAIREVRYGGSADGLKSVVYKENRVEDIQLTADETGLTIVYNLLGRVSPQWPYVLTDEDLLEHIRYLQFESTRPRNLFDELNRSHLLFLGEGYSDWLARFFIRTTKSGPLSSARRVKEFLADARAGRDAGLVTFLRRFSHATQVFPGGAVEFVDELYRRWSAAPQQTTATRDWREPPPGAVFLSYSRPDIAAVKSLKQALEARGVVAWFDEDQLEFGDLWIPRVEEYIRRKALLFVPVLSPTTESRHIAKFRREWNVALERNKDHTGSPLPFILPVGLKGTSFRHVPPEFRAVNIKEHDGGAGTEQIVARIVELVGQWRSLGGS